MNSFQVQSSHYVYVQAAAWDAKSEGAFVRTREQTIASSVLMQKTHSDSVTLVAYYCRNTRNICTTNEICVKGVTD